MQLYPGVDWLLDCEPRPAQIEALARSYTGIAYQDRRDGPIDPRVIRNSGPARGWGHFMQQRVGKTPTALAEYALFQRDYGFHRMVVFSPNKYKYTWAKEISRFGLLDPVHVFEASRTKANQQFIDGGKGILIVNWEALVYDRLADMIDGFVDDLTYVVADESILIKSPESATFKNAMRVTKGRGVTRPMTGKPVVQGPQDLYSQLRFARKIEGWLFTNWKNTFCQKGGFKGRQIVGVKKDAVPQLHGILFQSAFQARRADWATSFEPDYEIRTLDMPEELKRPYFQMEEEFMVWLDSGEILTVDQIVTKHQKLMQISSGFIYDENKNPRWLVPPAQNPKLQDLLFSLENIIEGKTIVIAVHDATIDMLLEQLKQYQPAVIRGGKKGKERDVEAEKVRFNTDPACRVMLGQERAIKYGHTLMGTPEDPCLTHYYFENSYSLDDRDQSEQRNQGEGQLSATNVVDPVCSEIEEKIIDALQRKENVASVVMNYYNARKPNRSRKNAEAKDW